MGNLRLRDFTNIYERYTKYILRTTILGSHVLSLVGVESPTLNSVEKQRYDRITVDLTTG